MLVGIVCPFCIPLVLLRLLEWELLSLAQVLLEQVSIEWVSSEQVSLERMSMERVSLEEAAAGLLSVVGRLGRSHIVAWLGLVSIPPMCSLTWSWTCR